MKKLVAALAAGLFAGTTFACAVGHAAPAGAEARPAAAAKPSPKKQRVKKAKPVVQQASGDKEHAGTAH